MRQMLSTRRPGVLAALVVPGVALLLAGCGGEDKTALEQPSPVRTSASPTAQSPTPSAPAPAASSQVDDAFRAARTVALQSNLRYIDPALGAPEDIDKADAQCADLKRDVPNPDRVAARRFSTAHHKVTEADGKRINVLLRNTYCG